MNILRHTADDYRKRICRAMNYISAHIERELTLEEIAHSASFSMFHFHRIFKAVVGETVAEFTRRLRLELAANRLLSNPHQPITQIALDCGFSSSQNFAKAFRIHFGVSPTTYRNRKHGNMLSKTENALSLRLSYTADTVFTPSQTLIRSTNMHVEIRDLPKTTVAYVRKIGPYGKKTCESAFHEMMQWAIPHGYQQAQTFLVYWDNPEVTPAEKCRVDACVEVPHGTIPDGHVGIQHLGGGAYAICHVKIQADSFQKAWEDAFAWLVHEGYECADSPCFERYHATCNPAQNHWVLDICIPLKASRS